MTVHVDYEIIIIGAGLIVLAVARALAIQEKRSVLIIEKEMGFGQGISSRNSEVIHSGIYYPSDSLKAKYCLQGRTKLYDFCRRNNVWYKKCGKLVVAQKDQETQLRSLWEQAKTNDVPEVRIIDHHEIRKLEPEVLADSAMFVGCTGIISAHELMSAYHRISTHSDHDLLVKSTVIGAEPKGDTYILQVEDSENMSYSVAARWIVNAAGLYSDRIAQLLWGNTNHSYPNLSYSKGSYFKLSSKWRHRINRLIYPLPDKEHDSLGIHLTFDQSGDMKLGPDAAWLKNRSEDYDVSVDRLDAFYLAAKEYLPSLDPIDLSPDYSGIRPKLVEKSNEPSDFYIRHEPDYPGWINLIGIDSPGLTASLDIGEDVAQWIVNESP